VSSQNLHEDPEVVWDCVPLWRHRRMCPPIFMASEICPVALVTNRPKFGLYRVFTDPKTELFQLKMPG